MLEISDIYYFQILEISDIYYQPKVSEVFKDTLYKIIA